ncbi:MAG: TIGR01212 family radical SAM protein [Christensenellaceae bacterium]|jgi:radical SAM protein (TIGR01212 family)
MREDKTRYNRYSDYLRRRYGEKVYKLPVNLPVTCPNRDGTLGCGGCIYCGEEGAVFEDLPSTLSVREQLNINKPRISRKFNARKYIVYFQNFTNTYLPPEDFRRHTEQAVSPGVVELSVSTRPDCIHERYLDILAVLEREKNIKITLELGLQTVNYHTLRRINRGHSLAEFIDAVLRVKGYGFAVCTHLILNLPWDDANDVVESAKVLSALGIDQAKLHALYIVKNTPLGAMFSRGELPLISRDEYVERVVTFLEYLDPTVTLQRLIGRAPEASTLWANWNTSWWKIQAEIENTLRLRDTWQGKKFDYLQGKAVRKFTDVEEG